MTKETAEDMAKDTPFDPASSFLEPEKPTTKPAAKPAPQKPGADAIVSLAAARQEEWTGLLQRTDRGYRANDYNVTVALANAPELAGKIGWDVRLMAYVSATATPAGEAGPWTDAHSAKLAVWLQSLQIPVTTRHVDTAIAAAAKAQKFDPLAGYLNGLEWDGIERIGTWLADYCRADASSANSIMGSKFLIGAVARALRPGCRMDYMLVLEGAQGTRKSTAINILGGPYAGENLPDFHSRDAMQIAGSKWIIEVGELAAAKRSELDSIKAFITRTEDTYVPKYGKYPVAVKRWSVLIGNYNPEGVGILQDTTGNRRFWIAHVESIDVGALQKDRDQLWAEAVHCFKRGDAWWPDKEEEEPIAVQQEDHRDDDPWLDVIGQWLGEELMSGQTRSDSLENVTTTYIAIHALAFQAKEVKRTEQMRIAKCLKELGYVRTKRGPANARINCFKRGIGE